APGGRPRAASDGRGPARDRRVPRRRRRFTPFHRSPGMTDAAPAQLEPPAATTRLDDLAQVIEAYNHVTEKLQRSHDALHTEVTRLRQQLAAADAQLQRSKRLAALGEMAAGIAHEVRNPLAAIHLYAGMIGEDLALTPPNATAAADNAARIADAVRG